MGCGRARSAVACGVAALALAAAGCGAQSHPNGQHPQAATHVSVKIGRGAVIVQPREIGRGPEPTQQIPQNQNQPQPRIRGSRAPMTVVLVTANQTGTDSHLVLRGPRDASSGPMLAHSPGTFQTDLPTGVYSILAAGIPKARPAN